MTSCPERGYNPMNDADRFESPSSSCGSAEHHASASSLESVENLGDWEGGCHDATDFPFLIRIPTVVLRKHRTKGVYFVYMICVTIWKTSHIAGDQQNVAEHWHSISRLEWTVGHRYTTLESLHADLMGQKVPGTAEEDDPDQTVEQMKKTEEHKPSGLILAHTCLPRPLPGLEYFRFPRKRVLPTIPSLAAGRFPACLKDSSDWITCHSAYVDYPVAAGESRRVEQRRRALEQYMNRLIRLVWCVSQTPEVDHVLQTMGVESVPTRDKPEEDNGLRNEPGTPSAEQGELQQIKSRLISLLPILSE
ncbi:unnamed protein product [Echinostoma caproni]|uniref:PX domain-containing protein n=1 Tax=Echinostoma caproni TaxID=27848 RepID=A0A183ADU4_9TREM|nr:unnamed protein product [Echinostoma caproni]